MGVFLKPSIRYFGVAYSTQRRESTVLKVRKRRFLTQNESCKYEFGIVLFAGDASSPQVGNRLNVY